MTAQLAIDGGKPVRDTFLVFGKPCIGEEEEREVLDTLRSGWIGTGPMALRFEQSSPSTWAPAMPSASTRVRRACILSLGRCRHQPGDEVITAALHLRRHRQRDRAPGRPARSSPTSTAPPSTSTRRWRRRPSQRAPKPSCRCTSAAWPARWTSCWRWPTARAWSLVEDAAHAVGTRYGGRMVGALGKLTNFSFYANKNLTTAEGGMVTTEDPQLAEQLPDLPPARAPRTPGSATPPAA